MNILLVSIAFPPKSDPESIQVGRFVKYLSRIPGVSIEAVTSRSPTLYMEEDDTLAVYKEGVKYWHEKIIFENRYANFVIRSLLPGLLQRPDSKFTFSWFAGAVKRKLRSAPDIIYSRSYPVSSALLAYKLKRQCKAPWVLHLSDPWAYSSHRDASPSSKLTRSARKWNRVWERKCFEMADLVSFTSEKTIELYTRAYPNLREKFILTPNVFDDESVVLNVPGRGKKIRIVYTGGFGAARSPLPLLKGIREFAAQFPELFVDFEFLFTGQVVREHASVFQECVRGGLINHRGVIPYTEMIELQRSAHVLVHVDSNIRDEQFAVFFPSKLLEYMAAQRKILAITNPYSVTHQVVHGTLGWCIDFGDSNQLVEIFKEFHCQWKSGNIDFFVQSNVSDQYAAGPCAEKLFFEMKKLLEK